MEKRPSFCAVAVSSVSAISVICSLCIEFVLKNNEKKNYALQLEHSNHIHGMVREFEESPFGIARQLCGYFPFNLHFSKMNRQCGKNNETFFSCCITQNTQLVQVFYSCLHIHCWNKTVQIILLFSVQEILRTGCVKPDARKKTDFIPVTETDHNLREKKYGKWFHSFRTRNIKEIIALIFSTV